MRDNCPVLMQSEESAAPWNQVEPEPIKVDCCVSYCMSKTMPVWVENYGVSDGEDDFDITNFIEEFNNDGEAIGIPTLLEELQKLCREKIERLRDEIKLTNYPNSKARVRKELVHYSTVLNASRNWIVDDLDVEIEN